MVVVVAAAAQKASRKRDLHDFRASPRRSLNPTGPKSPENNQLVLVASDCWLHAERPTIIDDQVKKKKKKNCNNDDQKCQPGKQWTVIRRLFFSGAQVPVGRPACAASAATAGVFPPACLPAKTEKANIFECPHHLTGSADFNL